MVPSTIHVVPKHNILELLLSTINQVYLLKSFTKTHKHYNYLWGTLKQNFLLKLLKCQAARLVFRDLESLNEKGWSAIVRSEGAKVLFKVREYSEQMNISNQSKLSSVACTIEVFQS